MYCTYDVLHVSRDLGPYFMKTGRDTSLASSSISGQLLGILWSGSSTFLCQMSFLWKVSLSRYLQIDLSSGTPVLDAFLPKKRAISRGFTSCQEVPHCYIWQNHVAFSKVTRIEKVHYTPGKSSYHHSTSQDKIMVFKTTRF